MLQSFDKPAISPNPSPFSAAETKMEGNESKIENLVKGIDGYDEKLVPRGVCLSFMMQQFLSIWISLRP